MPRKHLLPFFFLIIAAAALAACAGAAAPSPTVEPTKVPPTSVPPTSAPATSESTQATTEQPAAEEVARPSNAGGPGDAVNLKGDVASGEKVFAKNCALCHGDQGKGGVKNAGSDDGEVPPLNPIDSTLIDKDPKVYATNLDLFIEHGSKPEGENPTLQMIAFGDEKKLTAQEIADVIAFLMSLNPAK